MCSVSALPTCRCRTRGPWRATRASTTCTSTWNTTRCGSRRSSTSWRSWSPATRAGILARGNAQAHPPVFARFPPYGREQTLWMVKHALDIGLMGILVNNIETPEQAENIVRTMRPRQLRSSAIPNPPGVRGTLQCPFWGIGRAECRRRADLWPLNPQGDLLFWAMIETREGVENADAIAPGARCRRLLSGRGQRPQLVLRRGGPRRPRGGGRLRAAPGRLPDARHRLRRHGDSGERRPPDGAGGTGSSTSAGANGGLTAANAARRAAPSSPRGRSAESFVKGWRESIGELTSIEPVTAEELPVPGRRRLDNWRRTLKTAGAPTPI